MDAPSAVICQPVVLAPDEAPQHAREDARQDEPASTARWMLGAYDYPPSHRLLELLSFAAFVVLATMATWRVGAALAGEITWGSSWRLFTAVVLGSAVADLMSGVVHFLFDQLGSPDTPLIGQKFVKPFRDHHDDPRAMTRGDFIAVNSDNLLICLPVLGAVLLLMDLRTHPFIGSAVVALVAGVAMTNQIHKWAHMPAVPLAVRFAQRHGLILGVRHHSGHHRAPFDRHYCITFGRLDLVLDPLTRRLTQGSRGRRP